MHRFGFLAGMGGVILLCACEGKKTVDFPVSYRATTDTVGINEIAVFDKIVNDGEFLYATSSITDTTLFVYRLHDLSFVTSALPRGSGPGEVRYGPMPAYSNTPGVWLLGFEPGEFRHFVYRNSIMTANDTLFAGSIMAPNDLSIIDNQKVSYSEFPNDCRVCTMKAGAEKPTAEYTFAAEEIPSSDNNNRAIFASNGTTGALAFMYADRIDFLDATTLKKKSTAGTGQAIDAATTLPVYVNVKVTDNNIYALRLLSDTEMAFEIYDNDGNPVKRIVAPARQGTFTVDGHNGAIIMYDTEMPDMFVRIAIPD